MNRRKTKKILSLLLAFAMVVTGSNATFRTVAAAETSDTAGKDLPLSEEDGYTAYMLFTDKDWAWGNWDPQKDGGWGNDAIITGDGTYTVSIDREGYEKYLEEHETAGSTGTTPGSIKAANGANCFMVDFKEMATAQNFDISNMKVKDVTIKCDGKVFPSDTSKMYFGDIESKNNLRLEIRNEYGYSGAFKTREEFDEMNPDFTFSDSLSVTFTLEGIQKGTTGSDLCYTDDDLPIVRTLDGWNRGETVTPETVTPTKTPRPTYTKVPEEQAKDLPLSEEDGYTAHLMFVDNNWTWGNWEAKDDGGWGNDAIITGDGTYKVSIDREGYEKYLASQGTSSGAVSAAEGISYFMIDFNEMATAQNLDISNMKVKDVTIKCDGKVFPSDASKMYFGDIEGRNNLRLEICNTYGYEKGGFRTQEVFDTSGKFTFSDSLSVTFTLEGIQKGNTMGNLCYKYDGEPAVWTLDAWNEDNTVKPTDAPVPGQTTKPEITARPIYTKIPEEQAKNLPLSEEDGYKAFLMFTDQNWEWGNWNANDDGGWGKDAVITGDGTYTVSIDREGYKKYLEEAENVATTPGGIAAANGAQCFMIDFKGMATAQNFDISNMKVKDVTIKCDGKVFPSDTSKMYFGDIETRNNLRLEIRNEYGYSDGDFATKEVFDPEGKFTFSDSLSVTFTLEGIQKGNTVNEVFYETDGTPEMWVLDEWNNGVKHTAPPCYTRIPQEQAKNLPLSEEDGYTAFLAFLDRSWCWGNEKAKADGGWGNDAVITGDGTYTVSIDRSGYKKYLDSSSNTAGDIDAAQGTYFLMVDFKGMATAQNFDLVNMKIKDVTVRCDGKVYPSDSAKMYFGDLEQNKKSKNLRLEICNTFDQNDESFDPNNEFTFSDSLSITFTLEGIQKGNTLQNVFYRNQKKSIIRNLDEWNGRPFTTSEPIEDPQVTPVYPTAVPTKHPESDIKPTTKPENTVKPTKTPVVTRKPKVPSTIPPKASLEPTKTPETSAEPTLQPGTEPTEVPSDEPQATPVNNIPVTTKAPENQAPTQPTATPQVTKTAEPEDEDDYGEAADEGEELEDNSGVTYTVTQTGKKAEVEYSAPKENAKGTVKIPDKVTINGVSYKVTSVADNAFKNNDKIKKVVINKNITSIGKNAFSGCKNLKTITITSTKLTKKSIDKNAFKGISGKVVIKVPKGMKKKYKKLFRAKGLSKKVRIV